MTDTSIALAEEKSTEGKSWWSSVQMASLWALREGSTNGATSTRSTIDDRGRHHEELGGKYLEKPGARPRDIHILNNHWTQTPADCGGSLCVRQNLDESSNATKIPNMGRASAQCRVVAGLCFCDLEQSLIVGPYKPHFYGFAWELVFASHALACLTFFGFEASRKQRRAHGPFQK